MALPKATKRKKPRASVYRTPKSKLKEPTWDDWETLSGEEYHRKSSATNAWYYEHYKTSELQDHVWPWMLANGYDKQDVRKAKAGSIHLSAVVGYNCRQLTLGKPDYNKKEDEYWESLPGTMGNMKPTSEFINKQVKKAIEEGAEKVEEAERLAEEEARKANVKKPTIQELLHKAAMNMTDEVEQFLDDWVMSGYDTKFVKDFSPTAMFRRAGVKQAHARIIRKGYIHGLEEYTELNTKVPKDKIDDWREQLEEGYNHLDSSQKKALLEVYRKIVDACDIVEAEGKANRKPRKTRTKSPEDIVKKLKFKQTDTDYGLASILPADIVYARILVVFNTKNRKLGIYYAKNVDPMGLKREGSGLNVKGTTIIGYDEDKSVQRTIRKPNEFLPEVKKATRAKTEKLFDTLKTTETKLNGRINGETILIATFNK
jgi:hypothetical protein